MKVVPVIMCGGIGERFWPLSRSSFPKQLLELTGKKTLLEETYERITSLCKNGVKPLLLTRKQIADKINALNLSNSYNFLLEPCGKNTAPPLLLAAKWIEKNYGHSVMVVLSADHYIVPKKEFLKAVNGAVRFAKTNDTLVTFGIKPSRPETGYGYIETGEEVQDKGIGIFKVKRFIEKPSLKDAKTLIKSSRYLWNSGMFVWRSDVIIEEFEKYMPELIKIYIDTVNDNFNQELIDKYYELCISQSIDYGIMEKSKRVAVVSGNFLWDDIGSWEALFRINKLDTNGNITLGKGIYNFENSDSLIFNNDKNKAVVSIGLNNISVVVAEDVILIADRTKLPDLKKYIGLLKKDKNIPSSLF
ncbi:MAG: sugar phosphate nucleotidyltransferase [Chitinispirillaceae bacterium]|nr:sugar phosphate nucleotidyltransferase [Chitinispirillaceae bacterium]